MASHDFLEQDLELPLLVYGNLGVDLELPKQVKKITASAQMTHSQPYLCLYSWRDFFPDKLALFYESVRKQHQVFAKMAVFAHKPDLKREHHFFLKELGIDQVIDAGSSSPSIQQYVENEVFEAEKIGSEYHYINQIGQLIESKNLLKLREELKKIVIIELLNPKTFLMIKALLALGQRFNAKLLLKQVLAADPHCLWAAHQLSMVYLKDSEYGNMLEIMERLNHYHKLNPQRNYYLGNLHFQLEDYERSLSYFQESKKLFPQFSSRFDEGVAKNLLAIDVDADDVQHSLLNKKLSDDFLDFLSLYSQRFYSKSRYKQALRLLKIGIKGSSSDKVLQRVYYNLSIVYASLGEYQYSSECLNRSIEKGGQKIQEIAALSTSLSRHKDDYKAAWASVLRQKKALLIDFSPSNLSKNEGLR